MSSIRDLCDELGFGPGGQSGVLTQSPSKRSADSVSDYKYDPSDMLRQTRVFIQQHVTSSGLRAVDLSTSRQTSSPELLRISMDLLTTYGLGPRYWPESTASKPVNGYQWPQDKHRYVTALIQGVSASPTSDSQDIGSFVPDSCASGQEYPATQ